MANRIYCFGCRTIQKFFWVGEHALPWREPELLHGAGSLEKLPDALKSHQIQNILVVTDKFLVKTDSFQKMIGLFEANQIQYEIFDETVPNPTVQNVEAAFEIYKSKKCKALLAFGGGSAIDCAKGVGVRVARPHSSLGMLRGFLKVLHKIPFLVAIPTTAGTGSEVTVAAVISNPEKQEKYAINDLVLIPRLAVLDANITLGLPPNLTATTGMDALTHAVEAYIGMSNFGGSAEAAIEAGKLIVENLKQAYDNGQNVKSRENLQRAAYLAGFAFTRAYVGYVHAIAHSLGGMYHVPHGLANAVILPYVLEAYGEKTEKRLGSFAKAIGAVSLNLDDHDAALAFIQYVRDMNRSMKIPEVLDCIRKEDIPTMAKMASRESNPFYPVPKIFNAYELQNLYCIVGGL